MSSSKYLAALAVTDDVFLSTLFLTWLHDFIPVMTSAGGCKVVIFLSYTASYLSVCFVLCCTSERYVAVCHPLRAQYIFSKVGVTSSGSASPNPLDTNSPSKLNVEC